MILRCKAQILWEDLRIVNRRSRVTRSSRISKVGTLMAGTRRSKPNLFFWKQEAREMQGSVKVDE